MSKKELENQKLLEAKLRALEIKKKYQNMQAITGGQKLSSDFDIIQNKLINSQNRFGEVRDYNKSLINDNDFKLQVS
jgi:hypothetical protein